jgi:hypothetical protein
VLKVVIDSILRRLNFYLHHLHFGVNKTSKCDRAL